MGAVAVTDKGNLHGAYEFYKRAAASSVSDLGASFVASGGGGDR